VVAQIPDGGADSLGTMTAVLEGVVEFQSGISLQENDVMIFFLRNLQRRVRDRQKKKKESQSQPAF